MTQLRTVFYSLIFFVSNVAICQTYHPFPDSNAIWNTVGWNLLNYYPKYEIRFGIYGDTLIGSNLYSKVYRIYDTTLLSPSSEYFGAIREDSDKKVYLDLPEWPEQLLYDFSADVGDTIYYLLGGFLIGNNIYWQPEVHQIFVQSIDSILLENNEYRKRWNLTGTDYVWVEGIGSVGWIGLIDPFIHTACPNGDQFEFACFKQNDEVLFLDNENCPGDCFCYIYASCDPENGNFLDKKISVVVNQETGEIEVKLLNTSLPVHLFLLNLNGRTVLHEVMNGSSINISYSKEGLPNGFYIIILRNNEMEIIGRKKILVNIN